jgi:peptidoglycan-associated lipoprotein
MRTVRTCLAAALAAALVAGCSHKQQVKLATTPTPVAPPPTAVAPKPTTDSAATPVSPDLGASKDLVAQCKLDLDHQEEAPKFDFDQFELMPLDRDVLQQVAECLTSGPLKGHSLRLIGRADPRGTEEYNLGLGTKRAHTVASYLEQLGVGVAHLAVTTRGALDAKGTDDTGWQVDRRVDLDLQN